MNSLLFNAGLFLGSVALMSLSSYVLTQALKKVGSACHLSEGLLGIITALGADAPEISSSITALSTGQHELGIGVVLGSNIFNIAVLLGLSAIFAGTIHVTRAGALFNSGVVLLTTAIAALLLLGVIDAWLASLLILLVFTPYAFIVALSRTNIERLPLPASIANFLARTVDQAREDARTTKLPHAKPMDWLLLVPAIFSIIAGSRGTVTATLALAGRFSISHAVAGTICIAALTGIPNAIAAINLAKSGRGGAVATECFNSNTLNLMFGLCLPALVTGFGAPSARALFALAWLGGMTIVSMFLLRNATGLRRSGGIMLLAVYGVFAGAIILWPN